MQFGKARTFIEEEKTRIDDAWLFMRERLRKARKNYEMRYDTPIDVATGKKKIFIPLVRQEVNLIAPRFDLDPDAIQIKTLEPGMKRKALIMQELLRYQFKQMEWQERTKDVFPQWVNEGEMIIEVFWDSDKKQPNFAIHDLKDVFIFPKERDFWKASSFAVRKRVLWGEFMNDDRYTNKEDVKGREQVMDNIDNTPGTLQYEIGKNEYSTELEWVELYERHGFFPRSFLSDDKNVGSVTTSAEQEEMVDGTITIANIDETAVVVEISEKSHRKNFIEAPYIKLDYRWLGQGVGPGLEDYQRYYNKLWNRRDDNEDILHRGMFIKRRGTNIDATQRITGSGLFIETDDMAGIQQMPVNDITLNSYTGEQNLLRNVQLLDGTEEVLRGAGNARSATGATINDRNANTRLASPQTNLNKLFRRAVERAMELNQQFLPKNQMIKISGRDEEIAMFDDFQLSTVNKTRKEEGLPQISEKEMQTALAKFDGERFINIPSVKLLKGDFKVEVDIDTSLIKNKAGQSQFLLDAIQIAAQVPGVADNVDFVDIFDRIMDLNGVQIKRKPPPPPAPVGGPGGMPGGIAGPGATLPPELAEAAQIAAQGGAPKGEQAIA